MVIICEPVVAFSIIYSLETVLGAMVSTRVVLNVALPVTLTYKALNGSVDPSAIVAVLLASLSKTASVP